MKLVIEIHLDNAAFADPSQNEVDRILEAAANEYEAALATFDDAGNSEDVTLRDINGNTVGVMRIDGEGGEP